MDLATIEAGWNQAASEDAMFNILTIPGHENGGWDPNAFFAHGMTEIGLAMTRLEMLGVNRGTDRALDFGCGVGRLTQALSHHYEYVDGVDVSAEMVRQARSYLRGERCVYHHNPHPNLELFDDDTFDFVYSMIVLQHMPQPLQRTYVTEFARVLKPEGLMMFQVPDGPDYEHPNPWLSMHGATPDQVHEWITTTGCAVVDTDNMGQDGSWDAYRYTARKAQHGHVHSDGPPDSTP